MYIFTFVLIQCKLIKEMSSFENKDVLANTCDSVDLENLLKKMPKFELNSEESEAYWNAFKIIHEYSVRLITRLRCLQSPDRKIKFPAKILSTFEESISFFFEISGKS